MKNISAPLAAHIAGEVTTLATCWKLTRRDGAMQGFTDHDRDLVVGGVTYQAASGFTPTAIAGSANLAVDNLDVEGMLDSGVISESDLLAGKYDFAEVNIFQVNYADVTMGTIPLRTGWLGEVTLQQGAFTAEVRGLTQRLAQTMGALYAPSCRAQFCDAKCGLDAADYTEVGTITQVTSRQIIRDSARTEAAGFFTLGVITLVGGSNNGLSMEIKEHSANGTLTLALPLPYDVAVGNAYRLVRGCDKTFATCAATFNNAMNFRGEPHVPGLDRILQTAGTRGEW